MKSLVVILALLGLLLWIVDAAFIFLPDKMLQQLQVSSRRAILSFGVPLLGLVTGMLAALYARQRNDARWVVLFTVLAVLATILVAIDLYAVLFLLLSFERTRQAIGSVIADACLLFPIVVFVSALVYTLRPSSLSTKAGNTELPQEPPRLDGAGMLTTAHRAVGRSAPEQEV